MFAPRVLHFSAFHLTRKRKVDCNPPPKGKRGACGEGGNEPKTVTATQRVKPSYSREVIN